ncbi:hypothetical protein [Sanguibacter keddieii]|uniref:hypothetical protein n=1 Tax=Sanguibacter keddieii TaxID=60920 RepID=UPI0002E2E9CC|nr:hypothetical protein [Sanguibacter keddieii]
MSAFTTSTHEVTARVFVPLVGERESRWPWGPLVAETTALSGSPAPVRPLSSTQRWSDLSVDLQALGREGLDVSRATPGRTFCVALASVLARGQDAAAECSFFLWPGYAGETDGLEPVVVPTALEELSRREGGLVLHRAPVSWLGDRTADDEHRRLPVFVWPADGSFLLACPVYHDSLYVSCSAQLVEDLRAAGFEVEVIARDIEVPGEGD